MIRALISKLNKQVVSKLCASRCDLCVPINVSIQFERRTGSLSEKTGILSIGGETRDMSETGIAFYLDSIRLREHYLVGEDRILNVRLDLPSGAVRMQIVGQRYEQVELRPSVSKYLIGATIVGMNDLDREVYSEFLRFGNKPVKGKVPHFQTGISR